MKEIQLKVQMLKQPIGDFYVASICANSLIDISYSDVRRMEGEERAVESYLGIQRPLDMSRVRKIKKYLESPDATFPTGVIIAIDQRCASFIHETNELLLTSFNDENTGELIEFSKIAKVLDGQHRIHAFLNPDGSRDISMSKLAENFYFNVIIFIGLDIDEQANIFATVNLAQTKVNKSLVYDLDGLSKSRSPYKTCHMVGVTLDSTQDTSPLYHRIKRLGVKTKGRDETEPLTQAVFVESLITFISPDPLEDRNTYMKGKVPELGDNKLIEKFPLRPLFIGEKDVQIAVILYNYFSAIRDKWPNAWAGITVTGNILPKSNAFKAFMRFLRIKYPSIVNNDFNKIPKKEDFFVLFKNLDATDSDFTSGNFLPGSGGESKFFKFLMGDVSINELKEIE